MTAQWPKGTSVCRECRTVYGPGETTCDKGQKHSLLSMADEGQREALVTEVWGPPSVRRQARSAAAAGTAGGAGGGLAECGSSSCSGADFSGCGDAAGGSGEIGAILLAIAVVAIAAIALYFIVKAIAGWVRKRRARNNRLKPRGALTRAKGMGKRTGYVGKVVSTSSCPDPITGERCVAYGVKLRANRFLAGDIMLRDAASIGFDLELDTGEIVRIPAGRVVLDMHGADKLQINSTNRELVETYVREIDPKHGSGEAALPWDKAHLRLIRTGDRVSLRGTVERAVDPGAQHGGDYRESAASVLVPHGVPQLVLAS